MDRRYSCVRGRPGRPENRRYYRAAGGGNLVPHRHLGRRRAHFRQHMAPHQTHSQSRPPVEPPQETQGGFADTAG